MAGRPHRTAGRGEGAHPSERRARPEAAGSAVGSGGEGLQLRDRGRNEDACRGLRGRSQLLVYHFMFGATVEGWPDAGCPGCSYTADSLDGAVVHLPPRGVTFVAVSRAPLENLQAYRRRMRWSFPWVSAAGTDFNLDFAVFTEEGRRTGTGFNFGTPKHAAEIDLRRDELHGLSAFALDDGVVYHTYSCYDRGTDVLSATWQLLDRTPKGRGDDPEGWPRRHDEYE